jgi:hypothetical protein
LLNTEDCSHNPEVNDTSHLLSTMKFALIAQVLTTRAVASTSMTFEDRCEQEYNAVGLCFGSDEHACPEGCQYQVNNLCSPYSDVTDCTALTECVQSNCGNCVDEARAYIKCMIGPYGCNACPFEDTLLVHEFMKDLSNGAIELYESNAAEKRNSLRDARRRQNSPN